ncbi:MAG: monovalent cation/H+ antiporter subunit D family protein [Rickettsiales bacterium]|nr:monovalent cation/H+ antiporter subunit D family protein [Pseudomonadota bacterium]MDA0967271.1 monovalent cation/H+ antiporter subunit D family protein [Pseudomonadota bacterium]MDG4544068.1 monovalent cation/H+ antiporter subunit D family protein [Rickettsiales bacterium]MDG4546238.1 monovalent cation/H+ antiporter subunit D family protein [Rickettsiales bacterium]MDG4548392.1 monovalent cation/H+ antiporter subunit D family protein [Rickettsiales bacterium]
MNFENNETYLLVCFLLPLLAVVTNAVIRFPNLRDIVTVVISLFLFANILDVLKIFRSGETIKYNLIEIMPGLSISFSIEPLGMIFALIVSFLWIVSTVYSIGYMRGNNENNQSRFFCFFAVAIFAAIGVAFASNLLTLFVFYELMTICTFPLVTHSGTLEAKKSGRVYLGILMGTSICFLLPAIILTYVTTGTLEFTQGGILAANAGVGLSSLLLFLYIYGIGKAALMPIHKWLPAAMVAPTPVSALLHAVAVVKAGVFSIVKIIVYIFGVDNLQQLADANWWSGQWLAWVASFTIIVASLVALKQDNLKKMLAYSTVSQLSYVVLAAAILAPKSITAAAFHIVAHAFGKITLFFAAGSIYTTARKSKISQMSGIGKQMPITMIAFSIGALSMIGIPPAVGFISKWYMINGAFDRELYWVIIVVIISTLLNAAYFLPVIYKAFFENERQDPGVVIGRRHGESSFPIVLALMITAAATLLLFIYPGVFMELAKELVN